MEKTVYLIDDDVSVRDGIGLLLSLHGYKTAIFGDADSFLRAWSPEWRGCLLIDIRMPGMDGLTLQKRLVEAGCLIPMVIITGHGDVNAAREAFRSRAIDFLEKPISEDRLLECVNEAFLQQDARDAEGSASPRLLECLAELTPRELEVMELVVAGLHNRDIAAKLGISFRTVEVHKGRMMAKLEAEGIPQLVRISLALKRTPV